MKMKDFCEITNLPVTSRSEWNEIHLTDEYTASFFLIGENILLSVPAGYCRTEGMIKFLETREKILRETGIWEKEYVEIKDFSQVKGLPSREARVLFTNSLLLEEKRGKLQAFIGFNAPAPIRWIYNISSKALEHSLITEIVNNYQTAIEKANLIFSKKNPKKTSQDKKGVYTKQELDQYIDELLQFMESMTWHQNDLELNEVDALHPFKILYDVMSVIKMDFHTILGQERQNNQRIRISEEKYRLLSENLRDVIFIMDPNKQLKSIAGNAVYTLGYTREELTSLSPAGFMNLFHPTDLPQVIKKIETVIEKAENSELEARIRQQNGSYRWLELFFVPLYEKHILTGIHGFTRNIDEYKQTEEKLSAIQQKLVETALQAGKVELSAGIIHDIGNILSSVNISADNMSNLVNALRSSGLMQANAMLMKNINQIGEFLTNDPKGKLLPEYYINLGESISQAQEKLRTELVELKRKINIIKEAILTQQKYIRHEPRLEKFELCTTIEDALILQGSYLTRNGIQIEKSYSCEDQIYIKAQQSK